MPWDMVSPKGGLCMHHCEFNHCLPRAVPTMLRKLLPCLQTCYHTTTVKSDHLIIEDQCVLGNIMYGIAILGYGKIRDAKENHVRMHLNWSVMPGIHIINSALFLTSHWYYKYLSVMRLPGVVLEKEEYGGQKDHLYLLTQCPKRSSPCDCLRRHSRC